MESGVVRPTSTSRPALPTTVLDLESGLPPLDPSQRYGLDPSVSWLYLQNQQSNMLFNTYRLIMGLLLTCLFMGALPVAMMVWVIVACIVLITVVRVFFWPQFLAAVAGWDLQLLSGLHEGSDATRNGLLMALGEGGSPLDVLNLRLSLVDRDFNEDDYEVLLGLDSGFSITPPRLIVTDAHLAELPVHLYPCTNASMASQRPGRRQVDRAGLFRSWRGADRDVPSEGLLCTVCLDEAQEGDKIMTLPCHHQFHADCIKPWLKQQGLSAPCPICKLRVFA